MEKCVRGKLYSFELMLIDQEKSKFKIQVASVHKKFY